MWKFIWLVIQVVWSAVLLDNALEEMYEISESAHTEKFLRTLKGDDNE